MLDCEPTTPEEPVAPDPEPPPLAAPLRVSEETPDPPGVVFPPREDGTTAPGWVPCPLVKLKLRSLRLPRICGVVSDTKLRAAVTPVSRRLDSTEPLPIVAVRNVAGRTTCCWVAGLR